MLRAHRAAVTKGIVLRVVVPARMMLQFTWTGIDRPTWLRPDALVMGDVPAQFLRD
jgi:hypothetical protein